MGELKVAPRVGLRENFYGERSPRGSQSGTNKRNRWGVWVVLGMST